MINIIIIIVSVKRSNYKRSMQIVVLNPFSKLAVYKFPIKWIYLNRGSTVLAGELEGELKYDNITTTIYSTDASVYKEDPSAVVWPKGAGDLRKILRFARNERSFVTMRAGGTSLAGQVVSSGIIADVSRYMNRIVEVNSEERWARVEPGVVLDELNMKIKEHGLFFGPETSTSNRCNLGGMAGNNACGSHSLVYGSTRDHTIEMKTILSDGVKLSSDPLTKKHLMLNADRLILKGKFTGK